MNNMTGQLVTINIGYYKDKLEICLLKDDGTRGNHLVFYYKDIPSGMIPLMNEEGLSNFIRSLVTIYKNENFDMELLDKKIKKESL